MALARLGWVAESVSVTLRLAVCRWVGVAVSLQPTSVRSPLDGCHIRPVWSDESHVRLPGWTKAALVAGRGWVYGASGGACAAGVLGSSRGRPCRRVDPLRLARRPQAPPAWQSWWRWRGMAGPAAVVHAAR